MSKLIDSIPDSVLRITNKIPLPAVIAAPFLCIGLSGALAYGALFNKEPANPPIAPSTAAPLVTAITTPTVIELSELQQSTALPQMPTLTTSSAADTTATPIVLIPGESVEVTLGGSQSPEPTPTAVREQFASPLEHPLVKALFDPIQPQCNLNQAVAQRVEDAIPSGNYQGTAKRAVCSALANGYDVIGNMQETDYEAILQLIDLDNNGGNIAEIALSSNGSSTVSIVSVESNSTGVIGCPTSFIVGSEQDGRPKVIDCK